MISPSEPLLMHSIGSSNSRGQSSINSRHPLRQRKHIINYGVTDFAIKVAQFTFRFAVDGDAERRDATRLGIDESFARVFASVTGVARVMVVRTAVRNNDQQTRARFLFLKLRRRMPNRRSQPRVVLVSNAADAPH